MVLEPVAEVEEGLLPAVEVEGKCEEPQVSSLIRWVAVNVVWILSMLWGGDGF